MFHKGLTPSKTLDAQSGKSLKVAIVSARWNRTVVDALVHGCVQGLTSLGVQEDNILHYDVPGSFELPGAAARLQNSVDAVICVGVLVKGETMHFEYISSAVSQSIAQLNLLPKPAAPVIFGVLTCNTEEQAASRSGLDGKGHNHGVDWGVAAVEMAQLFHQL
jgi:6,7-dimethyl-8-ribityllumazine synthase